MERFKTTVPLMAVEVDAVQGTNNVTLMGISFGF